MSNRSRQRQFPTWLTIAWGVLLAAWVSREFFLHPAGEIYWSHERHSYIYRMLEFRETMAAGYLSPQWCTNFRAGFGSPCFSYYQPGFFYVASVMPWSLLPLQSLGAAVWLFSMLGYFGMVLLVSRFYDQLSGLLAGSLLLLSSYAATDLMIRGDLSEYSAMMILPSLLWCLLSWLERGRISHLLGTTLFGFGLTITHLCLALPSFCLIGVLLVAYPLITRRWKRGVWAGAALTLSVALASYYLFPVLFELKLVDTSQAFVGHFFYAKHFVNVRQLLDPFAHKKYWHIGGLLLFVALANTIGCAFQWKRISLRKRRFLGIMAGMTLLTIFLISPYSAIVWKLFTPLQKLQFPWRICALLTISLAALAGPVLPRQSVWLRRGVVVGVIALALYLPWKLQDRSAVHQFKPMANAAELSTVFFRSDVADEWMPVGASLWVEGYGIKGLGWPKEPIGTPGIRTEGFQRDFGFLTCTVHADQAGQVTLPHYHFVGWKAKLNGKAVDLSQDEHGLIQIDLQQGDSGQLEIRFGATPARKIGTWVSAASLLMGILCFAILFRNERKTAVK